MMSDASRGELALVTAASLITILVGAAAASPYSVGILFGDSMKPTIEPCDIYVINTSDTTLERGQIGSYYNEQDDAYYLHRAVEDGEFNGNKTYDVQHDGDRWYMKGDNDESIDYPPAVDNETVRGTYVTHLETPDQLDPLCQG